MSRLREPTVLVAVHRNPHVERIVQSLRATPEMYAPQLVFAGDVAQRLERNRNLDSVAISRDHPLRFHHQIETEIFALAFGPNPICLDAKRIEVKLVSASLIVEGIEENADVVVVPDVVAFRDVRADLGGIVETVKRDVKKAGVVTKSYFGAVFRDEIVAGLDLVEVFQHNRRFPDFVIEFSIDH